MSSGWADSDRKQELPADWPQLRRAVIARDKTCRWRVGSRRGPVCGRPGNQVDHISPGSDHSLENLQLLCEDHHKLKSAREGRAAQVAMRKAAYQPEGHPAFD
jgi:5-methylcytosine-specific restriction enzyme A